MAVPNATPFYGSKLTLISKSEIRYEGYLYTIDANESTIALAQVRSFGSEDRIVDRPVPPRDDIFEFIIFRAHDIKDIVVNEEPRSPALSDPAILQAHSNSTTFPASFSQSSINANPPASIAQHLQRAGVQSTASKTNETTTVSQSIPDSTKTKPTNSTANVVSQGNKQNNAANVKQQNRNFNQQKPQQQQQNRMPYNVAVDGGNNNHGGMRSNNNFVRRNNNNNNNRGRVEENNFHQRSGHQNFRHNFNRFQPRGHAGLNRRPNWSFNNNRQGQKPAFNPIPDSDFDFEKAQNDFKILEEKMENLKVNGAPTVASVEAANGDSAPETKLTAEEEAQKETCYNKTKSFFDKISCEALEREKGNVQRVDWKAERNLNRETFGVIGTRRNNSYRPGSRGGYNGGYRNYNQSYRNRNSHKRNTNNQNQQQNTGTPKQQNNKTNGVPTSTTSTNGSASTGANILSAFVSSPSTQQVVSPAKN